MGDFFGGLANLGSNVVHGIGSGLESVGGFVFGNKNNKSIFGTVGNWIENNPNQTKALTSLVGAGLTYSLGKSQMKQQKAMFDRQQGLAEDYYNYEKNKDKKQEKRRQDANIAFNNGIYV